MVWRAPCRLSIKRQLQIASIVLVAARDSSEAGQRGARRRRWQRRQGPFSSTTDTTWSLQLQVCKPKTEESARAPADDATQRRDAVGRHGGAAASAGTDTTSTPRLNSLVLPPAVEVAETDAEPAPVARQRLLHARCHSAAAAWLLVAVWCYVASECHCLISSSRATSSAAGAWPLTLLNRDKGDKAPRRMLTLLYE